MIVDGLHQGGVAKLKIGRKWGLCIEESDDGVRLTITGLSFDDHRLGTHPWKQEGGKGRELAATGAGVVWNQKRRKWE